MSNPVRNCVGCGQTDDHPRHVIDVGGGQEVAWHMDCHTRTNPPCFLCVHQLQDVAPGTTGEALRAHLVSLPPKTVDHATETVQVLGAPAAPLAAPAPTAAPAAPAVTDPTGGSV